MKKATKKTVTKKSKAAVKSRATVNRKSTASKKPVASRATKRKGVVHHAKRIYRLTPKFIHGAVVGAFVGVLVVTSLGISGNASAENPTPDACIKTPGGIDVNARNANVDIELDRGCGTRIFVMKAYYAGDTRGGISPLPQQLVKTTAPLSVSPGTPAHMNVWFDTSCYYQVDLVDITRDTPGTRNPIPAVATGGTHDCRVEPPHSVACGSLGLTPGSNRSVTISNFAVTTQNADFTAAVINWGDGQTSPRTTNVLNAQHVYSADGEYTISVTPYFTYTDINKRVVNGSAPACAAKVNYTPVPPTSKPMSVCDISTKTVVSIDEKLFGTAQYPSSNYTTDLTKCASIPPPETPSTPLPPSTLAKTGPGAILVVIALAVVGGTLFHRGHKHIQHKRRTRQQLHHS